MYSSTRVSEIVVAGTKMPLFGCGLKKEKLKLFEMGKAKKMGLCIDWLNNQCVYGKECKYTHELPPRKPKEAKSTRKLTATKSARKLTVTSTWTGSAPTDQSAPAHGGWANRAKRNVTPAPSCSTEMNAPSIATDTQTMRTSTCGEEMSSVTESRSTDVADNMTEAARPELIPPAPKPKEVPALPLIPTRSSASGFYASTNLEPAPVVNLDNTRQYHLENPVLSLNASAPAYNPSYPPSVASESLSHTSAPSEAVYYQAPMVPPMVPTPMMAHTYPPIQYVHPSAVAALQQQMTAQMNAQLQAHMASQEKIQREYELELENRKRETARLVMRHQEAIQRAAAEQRRVRMQYERQLTELRRQEERLIETARIRAQRELENAARLRELESRAKSLQIEDVPKIVQNQVTSIYVPNEEVVQPVDAPVEEVVQPEEAPETFFTCDSPLKGLVAIKEEPNFPAAQVQPEIQAASKPPSPQVPEAVAAEDNAFVEEPVVEPSFDDAPAVSVAHPADVAEISESLDDFAAEQTPEMDLPFAQTATVTLQATVSVPQRKAHVLPSKASGPQSEVTASKEAKPCIWEVFDYQAAKKAGLCIAYVEGCCKSQWGACYCKKQGCSCPKGRPSHRYKHEYGVTCNYEHKMPTVRVSKHLSSEEMKYRQRQNGRKKSRVSKRDRFDAQNRKSLEIVRRRRLAQRKRSSSHGCC